MAFSIQDLIEKDILELLGIENLPEDKKEQLRTKMLESIRDRVLARVYDLLTETDRQQFLRLLDSNKDKEAVDFLRQKSIDLEALVGEEALLYKMEFTQAMEQTKGK